jgi:hypothetical protein
LKKYETFINELFFNELFLVWRSAAPNECPRSGGQAWNKKPIAQKKASIGNESKDGNITTRKSGIQIQLNFFELTLLERRQICISQCS